MKKTLYILSALLLGLVSCNKTEIDTVAPKKAEETGLVAITMKVDIPQLQAYTRALGDFSDTPSIKSIRVAVFGTSGYPQAYALAEPVDAAGNEISTYATRNGTTYYFKVLLPVYEGEAHVHVIANGPDSIPFMNQDEDSIMSTMKSESPVGSYWARIVMPDGILTQLDENGIMQTDDEGNFIPSDGTAHLFEDLVLVRNFAEIKLLIDSTVGNLRNVTWTVVNKPTYGSVAPMAGGYVDDFKDYTYNTATGRMEKNGTIYNGFLFEDDPMDFTVPGESDIKTGVDDPNFMYERPHPGSEKATCILVKAQFKPEGHDWDSKYSYYRIDLMDEDLQEAGYFPIYRNYRYQVKIHKVGNRGAATPTEAMNRDSGGNVSLSTEAQKLTDISDGVSRLYVEYVEKNFVSGGKKGLWVYYVPDVVNAPDVIDNTKISISVKEQGTALVEGTTITLLPTSSATGTYFYEFEVNDQSETTDLVSKLQIKADNGVEGDDNSTLYRDITLRVMKKMNMTLTLVPKQVSGQGTATVLNIGLPDGLPSSMFPLEFRIEDINHTLYSTGSDGNGNDIIVPVKSDKSIVDGTTNSFYFIRTVNESEYLENHTIATQFKTNIDASATTIYVANEFFKTQSINLLNDGMYVNPAKATVPFSTTEVTVEVEFAEPDGKSWTVSASSPVTITDEDDTALTGGTGNGKFVMKFPVNNSTTASVTRTATVTYNGTAHTVTITQSPLEFSITPTAQTILASQTTATVTVHAEEGKAWTASVSGPNGTNPSLSANGGTGSANLTVNLPVNTTTSQRQFTVTVTMTDPAATATATITQRRTPASNSNFDDSDFGAFSGSASALSSDGCVTVSLDNSYRQNNGSYVRMSNNGQYGTLTVTPISGYRITSVVITYSGTNYRMTTARALTTGSYSRSGNTGTWTLSTTSAATLTFDNNGDNYGRRVTNIQVYYEPI